MITKEATDNRAQEYCHNLVESLNDVNLKDIDFYATKLRIYEYILDDDQRAVLYEAEQILDALV
ncbi:MAG TPA: hypothetical protein EYQ21_00905 [Flavobacteriales bacterium]|jgi:Zn-dependent oligopeptidase|nr:hypothetical protein [Flavobacteriales bacterium]